ncbi:autoinducer 2 ABC transporter substrate-binding protein [Ferviditalea candida]|uniref:Autoinducer 2 ABC transporter substrate-binding protein n=1 Tax=Ferviditalea candida TaxID=3108399 RepID=A0ABU5ZM30_9BACL|nr:autoinducer 2 ABC transporter substrate-binding protein [Paenibacillaceae bacterium T2]
MLRKAAVIFLILIVASGCQNPFQRDKYQVIYSMEKDNASKKQNNKHNYTIGIVPKLKGIPYFNAVEDGAREAAKELGVNVLYEGPQTADSDQQVKVIQDLIDKRVDVIAVSANDPQKLLPILITAKQQGIRVITWDSDTLAGGREFFINMVEPEMLGRHMMDTLAWNTDEKGEFAIMTGAPSASNLNEWIKWIKIQQQQYYPLMKLAEIAPTDDDSQKAYEVAKQLLKAHPHLAGIIGNSSVGPPAAAKAVKDTGKAGKVKVVGLSSPNVMRSYLHEGSAQIVTLWSPKKLGYLTVVLAENLLDGIPPHDGQEIDNVGNIRVNGDIVIMGEPLDFTKENVDQYDF